MNTELSHADDRQLQTLLAGEEDSAVFQSTAAHVETCEVCRTRLEQLSGSLDIDSETRAFLSDYPWDDLSRACVSSADDVAPRTPELNFLSPPSHPEMLGRLGRYEIERVIGSGGMGIVLKAFDTELNRPVAIKVLAHHLSHRGAARKRFAREAKAAAAVVHEHVVSIHNVEAERDVPFLVMQYVAGESVQARVERVGPLDPKEILRIGIQAAAGLASAHEQGVVHRDVKPANILLENGVERVLITDFGLARTVDDASLTNTGVIAGTPHYMSPEQAGSNAIDQRTDLFSLGSALYFMATGHPPFRADNAMGVLHRICRDKHRPVWQVNGDIPIELSDAIDRLLAKKPSRRFSAATAVKDELIGLLSDMQQRPSRRKRLARLVRKNRLVTVGCAAALLLGLAAIPFQFKTPATTGGATNAQVEKVESPNNGSPNSEKSGQLNASPNEAVPRPAIDDQFHAASRDLAERLDRLDDSSNGAGIRQGEPSNSFWTQFRSVEERLERLDNHRFPADSNSFPENQ